ncbi:hypothetical protein DMUE_4634 [Dictyocoela muelleri]|nr:hypothetical protein DMUE_4634 [Dictyocoela muelleri]
MILKIIIKRLCKESISTIIEYFGDRYKMTIRRVIEKFYPLIPEMNIENDKFSGPGFIIQIDETMLNNKYKSHRVRSSRNRTDALCIVECRSDINRAYACIIPNKKMKNIMPIIMNNVIPGSII